jgi:hypothetical protein
MTCILHEHNICTTQTSQNTSEHHMYSTSTSYVYHMNIIKKNIEHHVYTASTSQKNHRT